MKWRGNLLLKHLDGFLLNFGYKESCIVTLELIMHATEVFP